MEYNSLNYRILKTSPIPYLFVKSYKISTDEYSFIIKDSSDTFNNILNKNKSEILNKDICELLLFEENKYIYNSIKSEETINIYIPVLHGIYILISNKICENQYAIWINEIKEEVENENYKNIKTDFFANLSHELRTPLNIIFSSLQVLNQKTLNDKIRNKQEVITKYTDIAMQNAYRLLKLVNNLIDSNKITSGYFDYDPQNYDIVFFIESICQSIVEFAKSKDIEIIFDTDIEEKIISFDLDKMERIILNLLSNAIKFSKAKGRINIYIKLVDDMIEVEISDNGIGIPENKLESIFDRFKQVDNHCVRKGEGSGIGLYLVKSLLDMHNGCIYVFSELGKGTTFTMKIPAVIENEEICTIIDKNLQESYIEKIKVEFSDIYA